LIPLSELRSLVPREKFTLAAFFCRSRHLLQETVLERLTMRSWIRALQAEGRESAGATRLERPVEIDIAARSQFILVQYRKGAGFQVRLAYLSNCSNTNFG
jgi:hypothetical protein